jgi:ABC-type Fe3+ transport system permease subunit
MLMGGLIPGLLVGIVLILTGQSWLSGIISALIIWLAMVAAQYFMAVRKSK